MDDSIHTFEGHAGGVYAVAWSPTQSDLVATGGGDDKAFIWRVGQEAFEETGGAFLELSGHSDTVSRLAFSNDGSTLATGGMDGRVKVWEVSTGRCLQTLEGPGEAVEWLAWHPKGNVVLAGAADFTAWMWLAQTGVCMQVGEPSPGLQSGQCVAQQAVAAGWQKLRCTPMLQVFTGHSGSVTCGGFTPNGKQVVTGGGEGDATLRVWDPKSGECVVTVTGHPFHTAGLTSLDIHPDSAVVATGSEDGTAKVVNIQHGRVVSTLAGHDEDTSVEAVAFSRRLPIVMTAGMDGKLLLWDVTTAQTRAACEHPAVSALRRVCAPGMALICGVRRGPVAVVFTLDWLPPWCRASPVY